MNTPCRERRITATAATGFTLVEVLVALLVIGIGLLGVAKLVLAAVKANDSAYFRGQAADLAYAILDDMRANRQYALTSPGYATAFGAVPAPAVSCLGSGSNCNSGQLAQYDIYLWKLRLNAGTLPSTGVTGALPSGDGQIVMGSVPGTNQVTATITIEWDDSIAQWAFGTPSTTTPSLTTFTLETAL